ncbi:aromatic acid exporter family protein [Nocardioides sp. InS609-2]|uniref:FUSC family protein n=1 Tax=Nocardioides sp. InS609-2 TaxID=2760705 RepID=UPI0020C0DB12|nr:aromatic acid exporter family protein [Nocardioides sp. InS609-2]
MRNAARRAWGDALFWVDLVQSAKTVLAGVLAWWVARDVLGLQQPFLAPWSAILVVHATVYRTFARGAQQVAATMLAVVLASLAGHAFGLGVIGMAVLLVAAVVLGRLRWVRDEATTIVTTGVVVLATNSIAESTLLWSRLVDTTTGIVVGLLVNVVVWPPLRDRAAWAEAAKVPGQIGEALAEIADQLSPDFDADQSDRLLTLLRKIDTRIDQCWGLLRQAQEGSRFNPRRRKGWSPLADLVDVLHRLEHVVADAQSLVRTVVISASQGNTWQDAFRAQLVDIMCEVARVVDDDDPERFAPALARLRETAATLSTGDIGESWQEYGGVIINLRNVVDALSYLPPTSQMRPLTGPHVPRRTAAR